MTVKYAACYRLRYVKSYNRRWIDPVDSLLVSLTKLVNWLGSKGPAIGNGIWAIKWSRDR